MKLLKGLAGHPLHPPLTDATIGMYTLAAGLGVVGALGLEDEATSKGMWLALIAGLVVTGPTAVTGLADWLTISRATPLWRTATLHMVAMLGATVFFALAAWLQYDGYEDGSVTAGGLITVLIGFALLTTGGWLGGAVVFVHGMRVLSLVDEPTREAVAPGGERKDDAAV